MKYWFIWLCLLIAGPVHAQQVEVTGGTIVGKASEDGTANIFEGIPYAAPPLGDLRWRAPQPVIPWNGVRSTAKPAPACLQNDYRWNHSNYTYGSEDCLTLDVRSPAQKKQKLPVMLWIHGGSNRAGASSGMVYSRITGQGVVLVAVQYRLGIFGFLSHRALAKEQNGSSGNYGLMDQIAALKWVRDNIAKFGGDPGNVTIFGESAGSQDVSLLLSAPSARGLFHKAIMQSGTPGFGVPFRPLADAFQLGDQVDTMLDSDGDISRLRQSSAHALLAADLKLNDQQLWNQDFMWLRVTLDGAVITQSPQQLLNSAPRMPVIIGTNRFEFGPSPGGIDKRAYAKHWFGPNANAAMEFYTAEDAKNPDPRLGHVEGRMETDVVFRCPANNLAAQLDRLGWPVWRYEFDVGPDNGSAEGGLTSHAYEIGFIIDDKILGTGSSQVRMQDHWVNLAKFGNPNGSGKMRWIRYNPTKKSYAFFDRAGMAVKQDLRPQPCGLISAL
jgi:para-nitrobenzyl esterase